MAGGIVSSIKVLCAGSLAAVLLSGLARTVRWTQIGSASQQEYPDGAIIVFWHGRLLMMPRLYRVLRGKRSAPTYMLISQHGDGRIIALACRLLGIRSVAGSSSRGGLKALLELIRFARAGSDVGFTPDGPRGPRYEVKEGVVVAAAKSGCPIIPCTYSTQRRWQLRSWDGMIIPQPFSRGVFIVGEAIKVADGDSTDVAREKLQSVLNELTKQADEYWPAA